MNEEPRAPWPEPAAPTAPQPPAQAPNPASPAAAPSAAPPPPAPPAAPARPAAPAGPSSADAATAMLAKLDTAEQMALLGAALIIFVEIVFGVLLGAYYAGQISFLAAVAVVVAAWIRHVRGGEVPLGYVTVVRIAGYTVGLIAILGVFGDIRSGIFDGVAAILGGLAYYIGAVLMVAGAWMLKGR